MNTEKVIKELENRGYTVSDESGVLMISGKYLNLDEAMAQIKKELETLDFHGSWGTKGYPKGKVPKITKPEPAEKADETIDEDEMYEADDVGEVDESGAAEPDKAGAVDAMSGADTIADSDSDTDSTSDSDADEYLDDSLDDDEDPFEGVDHIRDINDFDSDDFGQMSFNFL
ncbi:MAG: hypothetical protein IJS12_04090 [Lachnospiraceae bacterium]|nr:hypothetical protein [Lachnospiraceae bacterium]